MTRKVTALVAGGSLAVGFAVAQGTGLRWLGGLVLLVALGVCGASWRSRNRLGVVALIAVGYVGLFAVAHVLALGLDVPAWLAVGLVAAVMVGLSAGLDRTAA